MPILTDRHLKTFTTTLQRLAKLAGRNSLKLSKVNYCHFMKAILPGIISALRNLADGEKHGRLTAEKLHYVLSAKVLQFTKVTNKWMKRMGKELGFKLKLTTYVARHSFATILRKGWRTVGVCQPKPGA